MIFSTSKSLSADTLVNFQRRFTYTPIPKVACSTLKHWFLLGVGGNACSDLQRGEIHHVAQPFAYEKCRPQIQRAVVKNFRHILFVRNPWQRLVSAYVDKFVGLDPINFASKEVIEQIYKQDGNHLDLSTDYQYRVGKKTFSLRIDPNLDYRDVVSFSRFVAYVCSTDDKCLNAHWRPQHHFVPKVQTLLVGKVENLSADLESFSKQLDVPFLEKKVNASVYAPSDAGAYQGDLTPQILRGAGAKPSFDSLFSRETFRMVSERFNRDIEQFGYSDWGRDAVRSLRY